MGQLGCEVLRASILAHRKARHAGAGWRQWIKAISIQKHITETQLIAGRKVLVNANAERVFVLAQDLGGIVQVQHAVRIRGVRQSVKVQHILSVGVDERHLATRQRRRVSRRKKVEERSAF